MEKAGGIPTQRMEAFSDGVIAILMTVMVFDLKFTTTLTAENFRQEWMELLPKFLSYALSFLMVAVMWVNHHQLFHQIKHSSGKLLWLNLHLLFWMSLIPFGTHFVGGNPWMPAASSAYGLIFFLNALAFTLLRGHVGRQRLLHSFAPAHRQRFIQRKNRITLAIYAASALLPWVSVYLSFALFLLVPALYFVPEKITVPENKDNNP
jgi:uncharacterized membrane protein